MEDAVASTVGWRGALGDLRQEHGWRALTVEGDVPSELRGALFRNGPGLFSMGNGPQAVEPIRHWFDGVGAVSGVRFGPDGVEGTVRMVRPPSLEVERNTGVRTHWGFGAPPHSWWRRLLHRSRNSANTNVVSWQGRMFALYEGNLPTELDPSSLETIGEVDLDGVIPLCFSAHPHRVRARQTLYGFGVRWALRPMLDVFALPDHGTARRMCSIPLDGIPFIHDFAATQNHLVFIVPPARLDRWRQLAGLGTPRDNLRWRPELGTEIVVVPIDAPHEFRRYRTDPFWVWHPANAYEDSQGEIVVDLVSYPALNTLGWLDGILEDHPKCPADGFPSRVRIDQKSGAVRHDRLSGVAAEFPRVDPRVDGAKHTRFWVAGHRSQSASLAHLQDGILLVDVAKERETFVDFGSDTYCSEPVVVSRPDSDTPDDGWVLDLVYDAAKERSFVAVVDAQAPQRGPLAKVWFDQPIPYTFHGNFMPEGSVR